MLGAAPTGCPKPTSKAEHDLALEKLRGLTPRKGEKPEEKPFGLGILSGLANRPPSRPYKTKTEDDKKKTLPERIAACQSRVTAHIARVNARVELPADKKAKMIAKLNTMLTRCSNPVGLEEEERDKEHRSVEGKLDVITALLQAILDLLRRIFPAAVPASTA